MTDPSVNPSNTGTLTGTMKHILNKFLQDVDDMLPARVISFDRVTNRAKVQPLVMLIKTDGETQVRAEVASVPVFQYSGGGFVINFPLKAGDIGWLKANDRDISLFKQSYSTAAPNDFRQHKFSDAMFFPDVMRGWDIDEDGLVIQTMDGSQRITIFEDSIKIRGTDIDVIGENDIFMEAETITLRADYIIFDTPTTEMTGGIIAGTNDLYDGTAAFNGIIRTTEDIISDYGGKNVSLTDHIHSGVQSGSNNSGEPV